MIAGGVWTMSRKCGGSGALHAIAIGLGVLVAIAASTGRAAAQVDSEFHEIETKYIFGLFTVGSSIGIEGERAFEPETTFNMGKRSGRYFAGQTELELEYTPNQYVQIELGPIVSFYDIHNVPGLDDRNMGAFNGVAADFRFVLFDRGPTPFAATLSVEPEWRSNDEISGQDVSAYGVETKLEIDAELIKNRLFFGMNLFYEPEAINEFDEWEREANIGASAALAYQIVPKVVIGVDLWYLRHYDGLGFNTFQGDAWFLGPTFFWKISPKVLMAASWEAQIAGHEAGVTSALNLEEFSRQRARVLFEFEF